MNRPRTNFLGAQASYRLDALRHTKASRIGSTPGKRKLSRANGIVLFPYRAGRPGCQSRRETATTPPKPQTFTRSLTGIMPRSHDVGVARYNHRGPKICWRLSLPSGSANKIQSISQRNAHEQPQQLKQPKLSGRYFRAVDVRIADAGAVGYRKLRPSANHRRNSSPGGTSAACGHHVVTSPQHRVDRTDRDSVSYLRRDAGGTRRLRRPPIRASTVKLSNSRHQT